MSVSGGRNCEDAVKVDRRVQYTKTRLRQSLLTLMREKPVAKVSVTELCQAADVNRNTFYAHFNSPEHLLEQIEDELFQTIKRWVLDARSDLGKREMLEMVCELIRDNGDLCGVLFSEYGDKAFLSRVIHLAYDRTIAEWRGQGANFDWKCVFAVSGSMQVIETWIRSGMQESPAEVAGFLEKASSDVFEP